MKVSDVVAADIAFQCELRQHARVKKSAYHHGDLANALVAGALAAVDAGGAEAVSLRDLAQSLGVSRAAPYRHFEDRDALLAAVAAKGFEALCDIYAGAIDGPGDGRRRLRTALSGYIAFAGRRPGLHALMFESDLLRRDPRPAVLVDPSLRAMELLLRAVADANPGADDTAVRARTVTVLSTVVGFLVLDGAGRFRLYMTDTLDHEALVEAVLDAAVRAG